MTTGGRPAKQDDDWWTTGEARASVAVEWDGLPEPVRDAVRRHTGTVVGARGVPGGQSCDVAAVLHTAAGRPVFLKGVDGKAADGDGRRLRWLRNERDAGRLARGLAPAVLFTEDVEDWVVVGFEYLPGRGADLAPGSEDLGPVAAAVDRIRAFPAPGLRGLRDRWRATDWWEKVAEVEPAVASGRDVAELSRWSSMLPDLVDGDRLVHSDLHGGQFLLGEDGSVHIVDWGWPAAGAAWVDTAFMVIRLVEAGHRPDEAEEWARSLESWSDLDGDGDGDGATLTAFAAYVAGLWSYRAATGAVPGMHRRAATARDYAAWRLRTVR